MTASTAVSDSVASAGRSRREMAVSRVSDPARAKAEQGVQRFLDAALELLGTESSRDFTVQEVVERSGQSLRSFYQFFDGKHELLLALFEDAVSSTASQLREAIATESTPLDRLRRFAVTYHALCQPARKSRSGKRGAPLVMAQFAQQLLTDHPEEAVKAFVPLVVLCESLLDEAEAAGAVRAGLDHARITGVLLQIIMFSAFAETITGAPAPQAAEDLWDLLLDGLRPRPT